MHTDGGRPRRREAVNLSRIARASWTGRDWPDVLLMCVICLCLCVCVVCVLSLLFVLCEGEDTAC